MLISESSLPQGSEEWLTWRKEGIGGSEVYSLACRARHWLAPIDPHLADAVTPQNAHPSWVTTPRKIWAEKNGLYQNPLSPTNPHLLRGHRVEPQVRSLAEDTWGCTLEQLCGYHESYPHSRVSLDGFSRDALTLIEVKAPARRWDHLPDYPVWQVAYQREVMRLLGYPAEKVFILEGNEEGRQVFVKAWPQENLIFLERLGSNLVQMVTLFWDCFMEPGQPPDCIPRERDVLSCT